MKHLTGTFLLAIVIAVVCVLAWPARPAAAQQPSQPQPQAPAAGEQEPTFRGGVELVNILFTVKDRKGKLINTLEKDDFEIYEDGQRQQIRYFARETGLPLTIGVLVDTSISMHRLVDVEKEAADAFFRRVMGAKDLGFLISFDSDVTLLQDLTANLNFLRAALDKLKVNSPGTMASIPQPTGPFPTTGTPRGTLLFDALYLAASEKLATEVGRKAVVILTDGQDQGSRVKLQEAVEAAQKADVIVYGVLFFDRDFYSGYGYGPSYYGEGDLKKMCEETGGRVVKIDRPRDLPKAFEEISQELRSQYSIGYVSTDPREDSRFRKLRIKPRRDELRVQARKGYYRRADAS